jgi:hypothetical protein
MGRMSNGTRTQLLALREKELSVATLIDLKEHAERKAMHGNTKPTEKKLHAMFACAVGELIQMRLGQRVHIGGTVS